MGKRMQSEEPKALVLYKGRPFITHILETISKLEFQTSPIIVVGYKKERIMEVLGGDYKYAIQENQLGTGDAVKSAKKYIQDDDQTILVISADQPTVSKETIENIIKTHINKKAVITLGTVVVPDFEDWHIGMKNFGRIVRNKNNEVLKIVEFKDANDVEKNITELNLSLYAFDKNWLFENIDRIENKNSQNEYYLTDLIKIACAQNQKIEAVPVENIIEGIHPNSKEELVLLESLAV
jgi:bifunctional UDP-N-acetylglucosamine pyrophosphorylase/glucosamine-1-phosphate N-acetyltransferase